MQVGVDTPIDRRGASEKSRSNLKPFQKGTSGNPGGKSKVLGEIQSLARTKTKRAFERIVELIESEDERVAFMASREVIDRAYGKARPADDENGKNGNVTINILRLGDGNNAPAQLEAETVSVRTLELSRTGG